MLRISNQDIATLKRELKYGPKLSRAERVEYLRRTIAMLENKQRSLNRTVITGLLKNCKLHNTAKGHKLCSYSLAVISDGRDGTYTMLVDCISWNGQAERIAALPEDAKVYVSGKLRNHSWTDKEGQKRYKLQVVSETAEEVQSLNSRPAPETIESRPISDEDIPF